MIRLLKNDHEGISELKWCCNKFIPFLCIDPERDEAPLERDAEETIEYLQVSIEKLNEIIIDGLLLLPAVQTTIMAMKWLKDNSML
jgi:hypothetical protein